MDKKLDPSMQERLKIRMAYFVIWLQDVYISIVGRAYKYRIMFLVFLCQMMVKYNTSAAKVLYASIYNTEIDITPIIQCYYLTDRILSVASMYRWLQKFNYEPLGCVNIIFIRNHLIQIAVIDLNEDREIGTNSECCDTDLENLPSANLADVGKIIKTT